MVALPLRVYQGMPENWRLSWLTTHGKVKFSMGSTTPYTLENCGEVTSPRGWACPPPAGSPTPRRGHVTVTGG